MRCKDVRKDKKTKRESGEKEIKHKNTKDMSMKVEKNQDYKNKEK